MNFFAYLVVFMGLSVGNYFWAACQLNRGDVLLSKGTFKNHHFEAAFERSYFQGYACLACWVFGLILGSIP